MNNKKKLNTLCRTRKILRLQNSVLGILTPPYIIIHLEDVEKEIIELERQLSTTPIYTIPQKKNAILAYLLLATMCSAAFHIIRFNGGMEPVELATYDLMMQHRIIFGEDTPNKDIVVVEITKQDLEQDYKENTAARKTIPNNIISTKEIIKKLNILANYKSKLIVFLPMRGGVKVDEFITNGELSNLINKNKNILTGFGSTDLNIPDSPLNKVSCELIGVINYPFDEGTTVVRKHRTYFSDYQKDDKYIDIIKKYGDTTEITPECKENIYYSLSFIAASKHLNIKLEDLVEKIAIVTEVNEKYGAYQATKTEDSNQPIPAFVNETMINFKRGSKSFVKCSFQDITSNPNCLDLESKKIVVIGYSSNNESMIATPVGNMSRAFLNANMISEIINYHKNKGKLIKQFPFADVIFIYKSVIYSLIMFGFVYGMFEKKNIPNKYIILSFLGIATIEIFLAYLICLHALINGLWISSFTTSVASTVTTLIFSLILNNKLSNHSIMESEDNN